MPKTMARESCRAEMIRRTASLTSASQRQWGSMSVGGMVCHLCDGYRMAMREMTVEPVKMPIPAPVVKFLSLRLPMPWPKNIKSAEEVTQGAGGTPPGDFREDQARLLNALERFCACSQLAPAHPMLGPMLQEDWLRWGYLHAHHHLRQFSA